MATVVEVEKLSKLYQDGKSEIRALDDVSLKLESGKSIAIVGPSGSGKTTLLHMLGGLDTPTKGKVVVDGQDLSALSDKALSTFRNRTIGFVFQFFYLQDYFTAKQNVMLPLLIAGKSRKAAGERAEFVLTQVGLADRLHAYPKALSGGQMQRVAIARALGNEPKVLLADEPTGNLDKDNTETVMQLFDQIRDQGYSVITITHDPTIGKHFDQMVTIQGGKLVNAKLKK